jgi:hypothetical protein
MATNTSFPQQQPLGHTAAVRSVPSPQHGAHLDRDRSSPLAGRATRPAEEKSFAPPGER